ncbi:MAG: efflux RND transporter periplasmic adaptor subunit [Bacteroidales bacterium]|nr:efflux RND transporter periplasmic adaptor subunit [Bacteroidales bacterium]
MIKLKHYTFLAVAALMLASCGGSDSDSSATDTKDSVKTETVSVQVLKKQNIMRLLTFSSVLEPYEKVSVAPALQGRITNLYVEVGDRVEKGKLLAKMDETQYLSTKLNYENTKTDFNRIKILNDSNNIAKQTYDQAKSGLEVLETSLKNLEQNTYLRAPFSGVISARNYEPGELFAGQAIYELVQINTLKALVEIPETYFPNIKQGMKLNISSDTYKNESFPATVEVVYPTIDSKSHTFSVKLRIPNAGQKLRPGMYVSTSLEMGEDQTLIAPYNAVQKLQGSNERFVFLADNGKAQRIVVTLGQRFDDNVEIIADEIHEGQKLIVQGVAKLHDQTPIIIKN